MVLTNHVTVADVVGTVELCWQILCQSVTDRIATVAHVVPLELLVIVMLDYRQQVQQPVWQVTSHF